MPFSWKFIKMAEGTSDIQKELFEDDQEPTDDDLAKNDRFLALFITQMSNNAQQTTTRRADYEHGSIWQKS